MPNYQDICWEILKKIEHDVIQWSNSKGFIITKIQYVATFEEWDDGIEIYCFFDTDSEKKKAEEQGFIEDYKQYYLEKLKSNKYPLNKFPIVQFIFDTHENVLKNYNGSYFYRLR